MYWACDVEADMLSQEKGGGFARLETQRQMRQDLDEEADVPEHANGVQ